MAVDLATTAAGTRRRRRMTARGRARLAMRTTALMGGTAGTMKWRMSAVAGAPAMTAAGCSVAQRTTITAATRRTVAMSEVGQPQDTAIAALPRTRHGGMLQQQQAMATRHTAARARRARAVDASRVAAVVVVVGQSLAPAAHASLRQAVPASVPTLAAPRRPSHPGTPRARRRRRYHHRRVGLAVGQRAGTPHRRKAVRQCPRIALGEGLVMPVVGAARQGAQPCTIASVTAARRMVGR